MDKKEYFSIVIKYPRIISLDSIVHYDGMNLEVTEILKVESVKENEVLVSGLGIKL